MSTHYPREFDVVETSIADLRTALEKGETTAVGLLDAYLARIEAYDRPGTATALNSLVVMNPDARADAGASDARRARGETLGPLDGIPYTAKDSYLAKGLTAAAGSPAFEHLAAQRDAFAIERLRAAGAVLIGLTNMPPMANGGMQRGAYGRAESPYNADWLTSAYGSGSSNGSGTATAASFGAFGLGEETWSSGRAPASNNALCAYTPSRGVISVRGNWPLVPTMDVVVPHTRTMADLLELLDVIVADDPETRGDLWRSQPWVALPAPSRVRPVSYPALAPADAATARATLAGQRVGVPRMYINADPDAGTNPDGGIGGQTGQRIETRASVIALWEAARRDLEAAGAEVVEVDFPVVSNYESDRPGAPSLLTRGLVSREFLTCEILDLSAWAWDDFLRANGDPALPALADVDGARIWPKYPGELPDRYAGFDDVVAGYPRQVRDHPYASVTEIPHLEQGLRGLEETRRIDLEMRLDELCLDAVVFPAVADVGPADMDVNEASADLGWRNGVWVANSNLVPRHLGIPTVTVPMGTMADIGMPVGLTFAGRAYDDNALLRLAAAFEATGKRRTEPPRTPRLAAGTLTPGLTDSHLHPAMGLDMTAGADLSACADLGAVRAALRVAAATAGPGEWLLGWGLDPNSFGASPVGSAAVEDVLDGRPACLTLFDGHSVLASREALRRAGIDGPRRFGSRSAIVCDEHGRPTGHLLEEGAMCLVRSVIPAEPFAARRARLAALLRDMAAAGLTGGHVMDLDDDALALYEALDADGQLPLRLRLAPWRRPEDDDDTVKRLLAHGYTTAPALTASAGHLGGRIAPGYRADLTAFAASPLYTPAADLPAVPITLTTVDGIIRHRAA